MSKMQHSRRRFQAGLARARLPATSRGREHFHHTARAPMARSLAMELSHARLALPRNLHIGQLIRACLLAARSIKPNGIAFEDPACG